MTIGQKALDGDPEAVAILFLGGILVVMMFAHQNQLSPALRDTLLVVSKWSLVAWPIVIFFSPFPFFYIGLVLWAVAYYFHRSLKHRTTTLKDTLREKMK